MNKYQCQPEFYSDRDDTWEIDANDPRSAAERFSAVYDSEQCEYEPIRKVRVMKSQEVWVFRVVMISDPRYTAELVK